MFSLSVNGHPNGVMGNAAGMPVRLDAINDVLISGIQAFHALPQDAGALEDFLAWAPGGDDHFADLFDHVDVPLHSLAPDGAILRANRAELALLGYSREEYVGQPIARFHVDDRGPTVRKPVIKDILAHIARGETVRNRPARMRRKDGSIRDVVISSSGLFRNGRFVHSRCVTLDVTERNKNEQRIKALSEELEKQVHVLLPLLRALPPVGVLIKHDAAGAETPMVSNSAEFLNGVTRPCGMNVLPLYDQEGKVRGSMSVLVDPEDQRRHDREIEKAGRRQEEFLATLSMELRNAMAAIESANKTIKPRLPPNSVLKQAARMIDRQLRHVIRLLDRKLPLRSL